MVLGWKTAVATLFVGVCFHALHDFCPMDSYLPPTQTDPLIEQHFTETYYQARALFRQRTKDAGALATLHTLPVEGLAHLDLTIDIAVLLGAKDRVMLHMSGTHGVEGFTGSAIQSAILQHASNFSSADRTGTRPTVVLVHALNPFGFSQLRRVNENNVDLNRNWLSPREFQELTSADPNANGYVDVYDIINPPALGVAWKMHLHYVKNLVAAAFVGLAKLKTAMVSATYHFSKGIFFGGFEKQPSLVALENFLLQEIQIQTLTSLTILDVHTGLGPSGVDTLILAPSCHVPTAEQIFAKENKAGLVASSKASGQNAVTDGYANTRGFVNDGIAALVASQQHREQILSVAQEFGTAPFVFVGKALMEENAFFHHAPSRRLPFAEKLRDVFYIHSSASWKRSIIERGLDVFNKLYAHASLSS